VIAKRNRISENDGKQKILSKRFILYSAVHLFKFEPFALGTPPHPFYRGIMYVYSRYTEVARLQNDKFPKEFAVCSSIYPTPRFHLLRLVKESNVYRFQDTTERCRTPVKIGRKLGEVEEFIGTINLLDTTSKVKTTRVEFGKSYLVHDSTYVPIVYINETGVLPSNSPTVVPENVDESATAPHYIDPIVITQYVMSLIENLVTEEEEEETCPISMVTLNAQNTFKTSCGHSFEDSAINRWLTTHTTCPVCRRELVTS
jgi:Ring finger domain